MAKRLLIVFGAGCQMRTTLGPWEPTGDFEIWPLDPGSGRSILKQEFVDDNDPNAVIGMGELTLEAGVLLYRAVNPDAVAIAYGDSSPSLQLPGEPSENEVMGELFEERIPKADIKYFNSKEWKTDGNASGTLNEAANLLRLVQRDEFKELIVLSRGAHLRAMTLLMLRLQEPEFVDLRKQISLIEHHTVESVLLAADPLTYGVRIAKIQSSKAYLRFLFREGNWFHNFIKNQQSQIVQRPVQQPALAAK